MEAQIEQAVAAAMSPTADAALKSQAITFIQQVKDSPEGWDLCLALFVRQPRSTSEARMFALQVVEDALRPSRYSLMEESSRQGIQRTFMEYISQEYVENSSTSDPPFIRNKFAHALTLLFVHTYTSSWTSFFQDLLSLIHTNVPNSNGTNSHSRTNEAAVDLLLRVLLSIDEEVADVMIPRERVDRERNSTIKDAIRGPDIKSLVTTWYELMLEYRGSNIELVETCLKIVAQYVVWIDISLIVNDSYMRLIFEFLKVEELRNAACQVLIEIVCKGMPGEEKFNLINALNLPRMISELDFGEDEEFVEQVAKLVNVAGQALVSAYLTASPDLQSNIYTLIEQFLPFLLRFMADDYDDTSSAIFAFATDYIALLKKARGPRNENTLLDSQREFLSSFLRVVTRKMQYEEDSSEDQDQDPEDVAMFSELRAKLKTFHDSVFMLDPVIFTSITHNLMNEILEKYVKAGPSGVSWPEAELCLHLLYIHAEVSKLPPQYLTNPDSNPTLTPLGELIVKTIQSNISAYPQSMISAQYFEVMTRYYQFFEVRPDLIPPVLEAFLDSRGCHHPKESHRARVWYLFQRFIKSARSRLKTFEEQILRSIEDLLVVHAEIPPPDPAGEDATPASAVNYGLFDSQLYLFEAVGMLVSTEVDEPQKRSDLLLLVLNPLMSRMQQSILPANLRPDDPLFVLQIHHLIMAVGNIAKGFRTYSTKRDGNTPPWMQAFKEAAETIISSLEALTRFEIIRDATRFAFARLVTCVGPIIIPTIPPLINGLLAECKPTELIDFLPFLGLIMHKYKDDIKPMINDLFLPLVNRIFYILQQPATGTDDANMQADLRKGYLNFVHSLFTYNIESILVSETNRPHLEPIIQNIFSYAMDTSDGGTEKAAFALVTKMVLTWGTGNKMSSTTNGITGKTKKDASAAASRPSSPLPGFDRLIYEHLVPMCFEIPSKPTFDLGDAETQLVLSEIAALQKAIYDKQGNDAINYLSGVYFPRINCPPELATEYLQNLQHLEGKAFKVFFTKFIRQSRGTS